MLNAKKIVLIIFLGFCLSGFNQPVLAQDLQQKPNSNASYQLSNSQSFIVGVTNWLGLNLAGIIAPRGQKVEIPDFLQFGQWLSQASAYFQPLAIRGKIKDFTTPQTSSSKYKVCLRQTAGGKVKTSQGETSGREVTKEINWINPLTQSSEYLNATMGNKTLTDFDFDRKNVLVLQADECGENDLGIDLSSQAVALAQSASLGGGATLGTYLSEILAWLSGGRLGQETTATITRSTVLSRAEDFGCNAAGCTEEDVKNAPEDKNKRTDLANQGGFSQTILPLPAQQLDQNYGQTPITIETNAGAVEGKDPYSLTGRVKTFLDRSACLLSPLAKQNQLNGIDCKPLEMITESTGELNCDTSVPEQTVTGLNNAAAQSIVDRWFGTWCSETKENGWKKCKNDVIKRARDWCVDPIFALAIWIHESGASNYKCSSMRLRGNKVQDFGININDIAENFSEQLNRFVQLPSAYRRGGCPLTLQNFLARYGPGVFISPGRYQCYNQLSTANKKMVDDYLVEISGIYALIAPGVPLPTWPGAASCPGH